MKIWYETANDTVPVSFGRSADKAGQEYFHDDPAPNEKPEWYIITWVDDNPALIRKAQGEIDAIAAAEQAVLDEAAALKQKVKDDKGQGNNVPDIKARLDELVQVLEDAGVI